MAAKNEDITIVVNKDSEIGKEIAKLKRRIKSLEDAVERQGQLIDLYKKRFEMLKELRDKIVATAEWIDPYYHQDDM